MELEKIKLSYPVLSIETIIHYFSERKSTAIEWLLLEIIKKVENNSLFSNMTIAKILKDIFFIDNSNQLVRPCLTTLVDMKAVQIDGYYDGDSLDNIFCSQIHLTQVGSRMQEDGLLPAIENEVQKKFYFDIAKEEIKVSLEKKKLIEQPNGIPLLEPTDISPEFNTEQIRDYLEVAENRGKPQLSWLESGTRIGDIDSKQISVGWVDEDTSIGLGKEMEIKLPALASDAISKVLDVFLKQQELQFDFFTKAESNRVIFEQPEEELDDIIMPAHILKEIGRRVNGSRRIIIPYEIKEHIEMKETPQTIIYYDELFEKPDISISKTGAIEAYLPVVNNGETIYLDKNNEIRIGQFSMRYEDQDINKIYGYIPKHDKKDIEETIAQIVQNNYRNVPGFLVLLLNSKYEKDIEEYLADILSECTFDNVERISAVVEDLDKSFKRCSGKTYFDEKKIMRLLPNKISGPETALSLKELTQKTAIWKNLWLFKKAPEKYCEALSSHIEKIEEFNLMEVYEFFQSLKKNDPKILQSLVNKKTYLHLYPVKVVKDMISSFSDTDFIKSPDITPIDRCFHKLKRAEDQIRELTSPLNWSQDVSKENIFTCILNQRNKLSQLKNTIEVWDEQIQILCETLPVFNVSIESDTYLAECIEVINKIKDVVSLFFGSPKLKYKQIYVADTCALLNRPEIVDKFKPGNALLVIPMTVLEELDKHKENYKNTKLQYQARQVIKRIDEYSDNDWLDKSESADMELLPKDYREETGDNKILSTVLKFLIKKPTLISDDANFRNKAESLKISTVSSETFCSKNGLIKKKK